MLCIIKSQIDYDDLRSCVLLYTRDIAPFNEGHRDISKSLGKKNLKEAKFNMLQ